MIEQLIFSFEQAVACAATAWVALSMLGYVIKKESRLRRFMCLKCVTLWATLIITLNPMLAVTAALIAAIIDKIMSQTTIDL